MDGYRYKKLILRFAACASIVFVLVLHYLYLPILFIGLILCMIGDLLSFKFITENISLSDYTDQYYMFCEHSKERIRLSSLYFWNKMDKLKK